MTASGKTIEVGHTDAEGRMILADALDYASKQKPDEIIDFATLTGACVVALGLNAAGLFTKNDNMADELYKKELTPELIFSACEHVMSKVRGSYSVLFIADSGDKPYLFAMTDPRKIRPLSLGKTNGTYCLSSETRVVTLRLCSVWRSFSNFPVRRSYKSLKSSLLW